MADIREILSKRIVVLDVRVKDEKDTLISYMTLTFLNLNIPI